MANIPFLALEVALQEAAQITDNQIQDAIIDNNLAQRFFREIESYNDLLTIKQEGIRLNKEFIVCINNQGLPFYYKLNYNAQGIQLVSINQNLPSLNFPIDYFDDPEPNKRIYLVYRINLELQPEQLVAAGGAHGGKRKIRRSKSRKSQRTSKRTSKTKTKKRF